MPKGYFFARFNRETQQLEEVDMPPELADAVGAAIEAGESNEHGTPTQTAAQTAAQTVLSEPEERAEVKSLRESLERLRWVREGEQDPERAQRLDKAIAGIERLIAFERDRAKAVRELDELRARWKAEDEPIDAQEAAERAAINAYLKRDTSFIGWVRRKVGYDK